LGLVEKGVNIKAKRKEKKCIDEKQKEKMHRKDLNRVKVGRNLRPGA